MTTKEGFTKASRSGLRDQRGFMLVELLAAAPPMLIGVMVLLALSGASARGIWTNEPPDRGPELQSSLERMTRELRQATAVYASSQNSIDVNTFVGDAQVRVGYNCAGTSCTRFVNGVSTGHAVEGIANPDVFGYSPNTAQPKYVTITLQARAKDPGKRATPVTVSDGVSLRNVWGNL